MKYLFSAILFALLLAFNLHHPAYAQSYKIVNGVPVKGSIGSDKDYNTYTFTTNRDGQVYVALDQTTGGYDMSLYDENGNKVGEDWNSTRGAKLSINKQLIKGTYTIKIYPYNWRDISSASYRVKATYPGLFSRNASTYETNDTFETAMPVRNGQFYKSTAEAVLDRDVYSFTTNQDGEVYIGLEHTTGGFDMFLFDSNGNVVSEDWNSTKGHDLKINRNVVKGTYYVVLVPYSWNGLTSATYQLKVTYPGSLQRSSTSYEPNDTLQTAMGLISNRYYYSNSYSFLDHDVYKFTTSRDGIANITLDQTTGGYDMFLIDSQGNNVAESYNSTRGSVLNINRSLRKGTYYIKLIPYSWNGLTSAKYRLKGSFLDKTPTVDTVTDQTTVMTGKAETKAKVYAYVGSKKLGEATAASGKFSMKIAKQKAGTVISVYTIDAWGSRSGNRTVNVLDRTPPGTPTVNKVTYKTTYVTGSAEKYSIVYVYYKSTKLGYAKTDSKGHFKVKIRAQKKGYTLTVFAKDSSGNKSKNRSVKVY